MKKQISLIVRNTYTETNRMSGGNENLNNFLHNGYKVVSMCPMPSSCALDGANGRARDVQFSPTCLVILEEPEKEDKTHENSQ